MAKTNKRIDLKRTLTAAGQNALRQLSRYFSKNGYWRTLPDRDGAPETHRGHECRFSASSKEERDKILRLLRVAGIRAGKPFLKGPSWRIPVYGAEQVSLIRLGVKLGKAASRGASKTRK